MHGLPFLLTAPTGMGSKNFFPMRGHFLPAASPRKTNKVLWRRIALTAAAAVAALVVLNVSLRPSYDEAQIGDMLAYVTDYDYYSPVEELAENPIEVLYDDYNE